MTAVGAGDCVKIAGNNGAHNRKFFRAVLLREYRTCVRRRCVFNVFTGKIGWVDNGLFCTSGKEKRSHYTDSACATKCNILAKGFRQTNSCLDLCVYMYPYQRAFISVQTIAPRWCCLDSRTVPGMPTYRLQAIPEDCQSQRSVPCPRAGHGQSRGLFAVYVQ